MTLFRSARLSQVLLAFAIAPIACNAETTAPAASRPVAEVAEPGQEEPGYTLDVELPPQTTRGQEAIAHVRVHPRAPWHMNLDYPAKLHLQAPSDVQLVAPILRKNDAQRFDDEVLEFSVLFTPNARGSRTIEAQLDFAVCGAAACGPVSESIQLAFEVGCRTEDTGLC